MNRIFLLAATLVLLTACSGDLAHDDAEFDEGKWLYKQPAELGWDQQDTTTVGRLVLRLQANDAYPYQNLWLKLSITPPGEKTTHQMRNFVMMDPTGRWQGEEHWGSYRLQATLNDSMRFTKAGQYRFALTQMMRQDTLLGIEAVELAFEPREKKE